MTLGARRPTSASSCKKQQTQGLCRTGNVWRQSLAPPFRLTTGNTWNCCGKSARFQEKVFIRSGIRYDYLLEDKNPDFLRELVEYHVSGQLRVAPEHCAAGVLDCMGKPHIEAYIAFQRQFTQLTRQLGKEQYLVPYRCPPILAVRLSDAVELALS